MITKILFLSAVLLFSGNSYSAFLFDISIISNRGIDDKLVLTRELHSQEIIEEGMTSHLVIKDDEEGSFSASFIPQDDVYGPSSLLKIIITVKYGEEVISETVITHLGQVGEKTFRILGKKEELVIRVKPELL